MKEILPPEGYWQNGVYYYYLKDHQGNNTELLNQSKAVIEYSDYYPDGMRFEESTSNSAALPYRYNGKELESMNGLNQYDYGARRRETGIPVWTSVDPLCEKYYSVSPYAYCSDDPVKNVDPDGKQIFVSPLLGISDPLLMGSDEPIITTEKPIIETASKIGQEGSDKFSKIEDHHILPRSLKNNPVIREARNNGFKFEGKENKMPVEKFVRQTGEGQHGNHPNYTEQINNKLSDFQNAQGDNATKAVRTIVRNVRQVIQNNPNVKINDLHLMNDVAPIDHTMIKAQKYVPSYVPNYN
ncbi:RHS repeat-associated core domain-containing protein [Microbacter margulisiae]|uniref:RHS repeat-associated protein n=1 Tax=Microbacter margulisiae TaxID=1350067 RepID=A0A7W5H2W5_9PORP|nr:RHS repeat-associated core domain-containing protein [Microbacter margulisiae]MBB3187866.1 RHS repeat-associated protein [Microbacter margulisiae]